LNESLASLGSSLTVFRGNPIEIIEMLIKTKQIHNIYFERDTEPYAKYRDQKIAELCDIYKVNLQTFLGHTLYDHEEVIKLNKNITPLTYTKFLNLIQKMPDIDDCVRNPSKSEFLNFQVSKKFLASMNYTDMISIPKLSEIVDKNNESLKISPTTNYIGGESEGLRIMNEYLKDRKKVINFLKPNTNPAHYDQKSTTTLSSYLKFGSVSIKRFYHELKKILKEEPRQSQPPCSLLGQIYWREFFYCGSVGIKNFHKMEDNIACKVVNWRSTEEEEGKKLLTAWTNAQTGYPWIDAIMTQLKQEGWIHHLARHSVACFLTRGDLYINWERGMEVFEELLLDADYALNAGNWLWLSGTSSYFTAYFRLYSPVAFPKKYDPNGDYVRHFLPVLKNMPKDYIYEPWKAPKSLQEKIGCVVGKNYPERIVIHEVG
jgi:cryptochrome